MQTFTLEEAAALIANKYGWHEGAHATLVERLLDAARDGSLTVRDPHTDLPYRPKQYRYHWEKVSAADLNRYFDGVGASWRADNDGEAADPLFDTEWWNPRQVLTWVCLGDRALVKEGAIVNQDARFQLKLKAADRQGARYPSVGAAEKAIVTALQTGKLSAYGLKNGGGDLTEIPSEQWADLEYRGDSDRAIPGDCFRPMENRWVTLRFKRKAVLAIWPDPLESLAMAPTPVESKANVEPPESSLLPFRAPDRQDDWVRVIDAMKTEFESEHGRSPNKTEAWTRLRTNPPKGYDVRSSTVGNDEVISIGNSVSNKPLSKSAFVKRWCRYTGTRQMPLEDNKAH